ncbi:TPA: hypothetical protein ACJ2XA_004291, partial [Kluyvera georgiana]
PLARKNLWEKEYAEILNDYQDVLSLYKGLETRFEKVFHYEPLTQPFQNRKIKDIIDEQDKK